ncbi:RNA polymerase sigma factor [Streptomyces wuyuanensis]|uniref:RNA polymerase sigma factor n=1 Tax=Streptomyces wuyuanensis TaxID=1196353 RepID=UPI003D727CCE
MAKTVAVMGWRQADGHAGSARDARLGIGEWEATHENTHRFLTDLARAADPAHADDLVQETWASLPRESSSAAPPSRQEVIARLLERIGHHDREAAVQPETRADSLLAHYSSQGAAEEFGGISPDDELDDSGDVIVGLDELDTDADRAELFLGDFYNDASEVSRWSSAPAVWPPLRRVLPEDEAETLELYSVMDGALDDLSIKTGDLLNLVDLEGHTLAGASAFLGLSPADARRRLALGRHHLRRRVDAYLANRNEDPSSHGSCPGRNCGRVDAATRRSSGCGPSRRPVRGQDERRVA